MSITEKCQDRRGKKKMNYTASISTTKHAAFQKPGMQWSRSNPALGTGWDRANFLHSSPYSALVWICDQWWQHVTPYTVAEQGMPAQHQGFLHSSLHLAREWVGVGMRTQLGQLIPTEHTIPHHTMSWSVTKMRGCFDRVLVATSETNKALTRVNPWDKGFPQKQQYPHRQRDLPCTTSKTHTFQ